MRFALKAFCNMFDSLSSASNEFSQKASKAFKGRLQVFRKAFGAVYRSLKGIKRPFKGL